MFKAGATYCGLNSVDLMVKWSILWRRYQGGASRRKREAELCRLRESAGLGVHCTEETIRRMCHLDMIQLGVIDGRPV